MSILLKVHEIYVFHPCHKILTMQDISFPAEKTEAIFVCRCPIKDYLIISDEIIPFLSV